MWEPFLSFHIDTTKTLHYVISIHFETFWRGCPNYSGKLKRPGVRRLFMIDGSKALLAGIDAVYDERNPVQR
jgi:hypothetical protein